MENILQDYYTNLKTTELLEERFGRSPIVMNIIDAMGEMDKRLFAAFCDGLKVTTTGYNVPADIYIHRASAPINAIRSFCIPVESKFVKTISNLGKSTRVTVFYMESSAIAELMKNPKKVIDACREQLRLNKLKRNEIRIKNIYKEYGSDETIKLVHRVIEREILRGTVIVGK